MLPPVSNESDEFRTRADRAVHFVMLLLARYSCRMDTTGLTEWAWSVPDDAKPALATRVAAVRAGVNEQFLSEARSAAEAAIADSAFDPTAANASAAPGDFLDDGRDMESWYRDVGARLRAAYEDAMLAVGAGSAIGRGHRRVLAKPLLPEVPGLAESLGLA